jgi:hypothetical protein
MKFLDQDCPFVHDRDFRAILFSSPTIRSFGDVADLFFQSGVSSGEPHTGSARDFKAEHRFFYTEQDFTTNEADRDACRRKWDKKRFSFRYTIFFAQLSITKPNFFLIILPLMTMARKLYPAFEQISRGKNVTYWRVTLQPLIEKIEAGEDLQGAITLKEVKCAVYGDPQASAFRVAGTNVARCNTLHEIETSLRAKGIRYKPQIVRMLFYNPDVDTRLHVSFHRAGHLKFFVNEGTANLPLLGTVLRYLFEMTLFEEAAFPTFKKPEAEDEDNEN